MFSNISLGFAISIADTLDFGILDDHELIEHLRPFLSTILE